MRTALALALVVTIGCGGSSKPNTLGNQNTVKRDDLSLLPLDSEIVLGINIAQVQQSALWQKFIVPMLGRGDLGQGLAELKRLCNIDVFAETRSIAAGMKNLDRPAPESVFVVHGLRSDKVMACLANPTVAAELKKDNVEIVRDQDVTLMREPGTTNAAALQFLDGDTLLVLVSANPTRAAVQALLDGKSGLKTSPAFAAMYEKLDTKQSLWGLANGSASVLQKLQEVGAKPKAVFGTVNVTDRLTADVRMRLDTPDTAAQVAAGMKQLAGMASAFVDSIEITSEGSDVRFTVAMSEQKIVGLSQMGNF
jgi:hypothetical protein